MPELEANRQLTVWQLEAKGKFALWQLEAKYQLVLWQPKRLSKKPEFQQD